jgi:hypothetical protein
MFRSIILFFLAIPVFLAGCASVKDPMPELKASLAELPAWSIILEDMREEGNFFPSYFHKYRIVTGEKATLTDWLPVPEKTYKQYEPYLGMTVRVKDEEGEKEVFGPPGYEYVGDPRYGRWQVDGSGRSFWVFYGQYRLLSDLLGRRPIYQDHYRDYRGHTRSKRPYYGPNKGYGTQGTITRQQKPDFFQRRSAKIKSKKSSFLDKVNTRIGRSRSATRSRSFGVGK